MPKAFSEIATPFSEGRTIAKTTFDTKMLAPTPYELIFFMGFPADLETPRSLERAMRSHFGTARSAKNTASNPNAGHFQRPTIPPATHATSRSSPRPEFGFPLLLLSRPHNDLRLATGLASSSVGPLGRLRSAIFPTNNCPKKTG